MCTKLVAKALTNKLQSTQFFVAALAKRLQLLQPTHNKKMQLSTSLRPEGHFVCQAIVYLTIAVVSFISLRVANTDPVKDAA